MQEVIQENKLLKTIFGNRVLVHVAFWVVYLVFYGMMWGSYDDNFYRSFVCEASEMVYKIPLIYFVVFNLIHNYLFNRKYALFFIYLFIAVLLGALLQRGLYQFILYPEFFPSRVGSDYFKVFKIVRAITNVNSLVVLVVTIKVLKKWYQDQQVHKSLEKEKLEAELKYLKSQVHPHFLFNTLNNLYSLTLKKSEMAPEMVLKLSELMSYMLYDASAQKVPLSKEVQHLENYISLEKMRYGDRLELAFNITGNVHGNVIAPMLLLPFIENGFKHGVSGDLNSVWATIDVKVQDERMVFKMENSKPRESETFRKPGDRNGIGLKNVRRRLDLLYPNQYELKIYDEESSFLVILKLNLAYNRSMPPKDESNLSATEKDAISV